MSYDVRFCVQTTSPNRDGECFVVVHVPEYDSPTYNYRKMFVAAMGWDYETYRKGDDGEYHSVYYPMAEAIAHIKKGLASIEADPEAYRKCEPGNGLGTVEGAIEVMRSWVLELTPSDQWPDGTYMDSVLDTWPLESLWWRW